MNFREDIAPIEGWLTEDEARFLYEHTKKLHEDGIVVEIGSWKGRSTIACGLGSKKGGGCTIYAVDPHQGSSEHWRWWGDVNTYDEFVKNIRRAKVSDFIVSVKKKSEAAAKIFSRKIDLLFIDGAHEYEFIAQDYELWSSKVKKGGVIVFHDNYHSPGVHWYTTLLLLTSDKLKKPRLIDTMLAFKKAKSVSLFDRIENFLFVFYRLLFGWIGSIRLVVETQKVDFNN